MNTKEHQIEMLHNMCQRELNELQISMERYLQDSESVQKLLNSRSVALGNGTPLSGRHGVNNVFALIAYDRYMSQMSTVIGMARKFNIHLRLNALHKTVLDTTETLDSKIMGMNSAQSHVSQARFLQDYIQWSNSCIGLEYEKDLPMSSKTLDGSDGLSREIKAIEQTKNAEDKVKSIIRTNDKSDHGVHFKFSDLETFLRSILPVKTLVNFTEGHTFYASITYVKDYNNLVFYVCEMNDYRKLYEISGSTDISPTNQSSLTHVVFGVSQEKCDAAQHTKCVWRSAKLPEELSETQNSIILLDFGEIIQMTEHMQLYTISPSFQEYPPMAIKCILKGVCHSDGIMTSDLGKCKEALFANEFEMAKFRVINQESRVLHLIILMETKQNSEKKSLLSDFKMTPKSNPFLDSLLLDEEAELEENGDPLYMHISSVYDHMPRVGPNSNIRAKIGDHLQITVTHVNSPISFYASIEDLFEEITEVFFWNDDDLAPKQKEVPPPKLNEILLAQYSKDAHWYRAQVIEIIVKDKQYKVFYIDFGNTEIVTINALALCRPDLLNRPSQAIPFRLSDLKLAHVFDTLNKRWSSNESFGNINSNNLRKATESIVVIILNQTMTVKVVDRRGDELVIRFLDDLYQNIPSMLMNMGAVVKI